MADLTLTKNEDNSYNYNVELSNKFNTDFYKNIIITTHFYGTYPSDIPSNLRKYWIKKAARSPRSRDTDIVSGTLEGLDTGETYTFYAYAQAANTKWYYAGEHTITTDSITIDPIDFDLMIYDIYYKNEDRKYVLATDDTLLPVNEDIKFKVTVKNYEKYDKSPKYKVIVENENKDIIWSDSESSLDPKEKENAYLTVKMEKRGLQKLTFRIICTENGYEDSYKKDNSMTFEFNWIDKDEVSNLLLEYFIDHSEPIFELITQYKSASPFSLLFWEKMYKYRKEPEKICDFIIKDNGKKLLSILKLINDFPPINELRTNDGLVEDNGAIAFNLSMEAAAFIGVGVTFSIIVSAKGNIRIYSSENFSAGLQYTSKEDIKPSITLSYFPAVEDLDQLDGCEGFLHLGAETIHLTSNSFYEIALPISLDKLDISEFATIAFGFAVAQKLYENDL